MGRWEIGQTLRKLGSGSVLNFFGFALVIPKAVFFQGEPRDLPKSQGAGLGEILRFA
jgi:hypothetical protein